MKTKKFWIGILGGGLVLAAVVATAYSLYGTTYRNYHDGICNTNILGYNTEGKSYDDINGYLQSQLVYNVEDLVIDEALSYDFTSSIEALRNVSFKEYFAEDYEHIDFTPEFILDDEMLSAVIKDYNTKQRPSKDAYIVLNQQDNQYEIKKEVHGTVIDENEFTVWLKNQLVLNLYIPSDITLDEFYIQPVVKEEDLIDLAYEANCYARWYVMYTNGSSYAPDAESVITIENGEIFIDDTFLSEIASSVYKEFTVSGEPREFVTANGETIIVEGGTWGKEVWKKKELEALTDAFYAHEFLDLREPIYVTNYDDIGDTYIEISIQDQHCWVYEDGTLVMDTDIVTGTKGKHDTPTGIYYILERVDGKYLKGADYKTWVDKWMRLTWSGIGLHDASWRNSFGNEIYKTNGSHGCLNLPITFAYNLYDMSYTGMPVIIY